MTEEELHNGHEEYSGKSAIELIRELLKLLLVLLWRFLVWLIKKMYNISCNDLIKRITFNIE